MAKTIAKGYSMRTFEIAWARWNASRLTYSKMAVLQRLRIGNHFAAGVNERLPGGGQISAVKTL